MTEISYVHGPSRPAVPTNEMADRGKEVKATPDYIPYLSMTEGEVYLSLLREQLKIYAEAYPDYPQFKNGLSMVDNALYNGVHYNAINGPVPDNLYEVASIIRQSAAKTWPASKVFYGIRNTPGIKIGGPIVPVTTQSCEWLAAAELNKKYIGTDVSKWWSIEKWYIQGPAFTNEADPMGRVIRECEYRKFIENLLNSKLESASHHMLYKSISGAYPRIGGTAVNLKRILHIAGVESLGNVAEVSPGLMSSWTEIGIIRNNAKTPAGPIGSVEAGFNVAANGATEFKNYLDWESSNGPYRPGVNLDPATITAIVTIIVAALGAASAIVTSINQKEAAAMASAHGFGTAAYSAEVGDLYGLNNASTENNNLITYAALGLGAYFLLDDN